MPELPEIRVYARNLNKLCQGKVILDLRSYTGSDLSALIGRSVEKVRSHGKGIYFDLDGGGNIYVHLMLTGGFAFCGGENYGEVKDKLWAIKFSDGGYLCLCDENRYAKTQLNRPVSDVPEAGGTTFTRQYFYSLLKGRAAVKNVLTDQSLIAGIGNAYADEILYRAAINPFRAANKLTQGEADALFEAINAEISFAEDYLLKCRPDMLSGEDRSFFKVHIKGRKLTERGEEILIETKSGRKTYYTRSQI